MVKDFAGRHVLRSKSAIPHSMIAIGSVAVEKESGNIARIEFITNIGKLEQLVSGPRLSRDEWDYTTLEQSARHDPDYGENLLESTTSGQRVSRMPRKSAPAETKALLFHHTSRNCEQGSGSDRRLV